MAGRPALDLRMPPTSEHFVWPGYPPEPMGGPPSYAYSTVGTSTPLLTPATDGGLSSIASTPASATWSTAMAPAPTSYFTLQPQTPSRTPTSPEMATHLPQPRPRRAHSVSHLRHSPYAHIGYASHHTSPVFAPNLPMFAKSPIPPVPPIPSHHLSSSSDTNLLAQLSTQQEQRHQMQAFERLVAAKTALGMLQSVIDRVGPVLDAALSPRGQMVQVDRYEMEASLDRAVAELKANFLRLDLQPHDDEAAHPRKVRLRIS